MRLTILVLSALRVSSSCFLNLCISIWWRHLQRWEIQITSACRGPQLSHGDRWSVKHVHVLPQRTEVGKIHKWERGWSVTIVIARGDFVTKYAIVRYWQLNRIETLYSSWSTNQWRISWPSWTLWFLPRTQNTMWTPRAALLLYRRGPWRGTSGQLHESKPARHVD